MHWQPIPSSDEERRLIGNESWLQNWQNQVQVPAKEVSEPQYGKRAMVSFVFEDMALWALHGMDFGEAGFP